MKKKYHSSSYKHYIQKRQEYQFKRTQQNRKYKGAIQFSKSIKGLSDAKDEFVRIESPENLSIIENPEEMLNFFKKISRHVKNNSKVYIDIKHVKYVTIDAIIYMLLFFEVLRDTYTFELNGNFPDDADSKSLLLHSGFLEQLFKEKSGYNQNKHKAILKIETGTDTNPLVAGEVIKFALSSLKDNPSPTSRSSYKNIIEAMSNTNNHAYEKNQNVKKWYLMALYDEKKNKVSFAFSDNGLGIIATVKKRNLEKYGFVSHPSILESALSGNIYINRSQTNLAERGKGLPSINSSFKRGDTDNLVIIANKAYYDVKNDKKIKLKHSFKGTLISWDFIKDEDKNEDN